MSKGFTSYKIGDQNALHFLTFSTVGWIDIFTRRAYKEILVESLSYCQSIKGLELFGYVIMSNHVHLIARAADGFELSNILRDFKKHTSKAIIIAIQNGTESRSDWLLELLSKAGLDNKKNKTYQMWRNDNHPIALYTPAVTQQKLDYIHNNPVEAGLVELPEEYVYSSAKNYASMDAVLNVELIS